MNSEKITTTLKNIIIMKGASWHSWILTLPSENSVTKLAEKQSMEMNLKEKQAAH